MTPDEFNFDAAMASTDATPPQGLAGRIANAAVADFRFRRRVRNVTRVGGGLAATVAIAVAIWFNVNAHRQPALAHGPIVDPFRETNKLMTTMTKSITVESPSFTTPDPIRFDATAYLPTADADRFKAFPDAARAGMDPVVQPAGRAMNRFVKDFGAAFSLPKPKM